MEKEINTDRNNSVGLVDMVETLSSLVGFAVFSKVKWGDTLAH